MRKKIKWILLFIIILYAMLINMPVQAARDFFVVSLKTDKTVVTKGDIVQLTLSVTNMSAEGGIRTLRTNFNFGGAFELATGDDSKDIEGKNNWTITYNADEEILLAENKKYITEPGEICTIKLKVKQTANIATYKIKATNSSAGAMNVTTRLAEKITASDVETDVSVSNVGARDNSVIIEAGKIKGIRPNTKVSQITNYISISGTYTIKNSSNVVVDSNQLVASGMKLVISDNEEYTIYVKGDLNGDGLANFTDVIAMRMKMVNLPMRNIYTFGCK